MWLSRVSPWLVLTGALTAQSRPPTVQFTLGEGDPFSIPIQLLVVLTLLTFLPAILISMTAFTRIIVVAHFLRQSLGTQGAPNNQILLGLSLFLTLFVMTPTLDRVYNEAILPYQQGTVAPEKALVAAVGPFKDFMLRNADEADLALFVRLSGVAQPAGPSEIPLRIVVPAFMISELKRAFKIGFILFLPFLVIDMVISSILLSIGMLQLPPIVISTPFKLLLFVLVDGWRLVVGSLVESFV